MADKQPDYRESPLDWLLRGFSEMFLGGRETVERGISDALDNFAGSVGRGVSEGIGDIRDRVVLGGWFGEQAHDRATSEHEVQREDLYGWEPGEYEPPSFEEQWAVKEKGPERNQPEIEIDR